MKYKTSFQIKQSFFQQKKKKDISNIELDFSAIKFTLEHFQTSLLYRDSSRFRHVLKGQTRKVKLFVIPGASCLKNF